MFKGVSNRAPYWQFHFGEGGGFELDTLLAVSFWGGRGGLNWAPYWQFHFGRRGFRIGHPIGSFILGTEGGVCLQVDRKSVRFTDSGWLSTAAASGQLC